MADRPPHVVLSGRPLTEATRQKLGLQTTTTTNADSSIDPSSLIDVAFDSGKWELDGGETAHTGKWWRARQCKFIQRIYAKNEREQNYSDKSGRLHCRCRRNFGTMSLMWSSTRRRSHEIEEWCLFSVFKMSFSTILKRLTYNTSHCTNLVRLRSCNEQEGVVRERPNAEARR
jgi:hypothetical protein